MVTVLQKGARGVSKKITEFQEKGISIIGISYDSVQVLKKFAEKYQIT
jgi:peroxiredoxin